MEKGWKLKIIWMVQIEYQMVTKNLSSWGTYEFRKLKKNKSWNSRMGLHRVLSVRSTW